jgi:hypothetical protein
MKIVHAFVHTGIESELLKEYGKIDGYGLDITVSWNFDNFYELDLIENDLKQDYDFGLFHPMCQKWAKSTHKREKYNNQIPRARELAEKHCDYWIIENNEYAPLENPVYLNGTMFGKPLRYERAFETNFTVEQPTYRDSQRHKYNISEISKRKVGNIKEWTTGYYDVKTLKKNCVPRYYLEYLLSYCPIFEVGNHD